MEEKYYAIDGVYWIVDKYNNDATPICPKDNMELDWEEDLQDWNNEGRNINELYCEDCKKTYKLKRSLYDETKYVVKRAKALDRKDYEIIDIDGIKTPVTKKIEIDPKNGYFCTHQLRDSKRGPQVVIYAGKKGLKEKSQIFIMPEERRLSFDQTNINPADVFAKITAEFRDGTKHTIEKPEKKDGDK